MDFFLDDSKYRYEAWVAAGHNGLWFETAGEIILHLESLLWAEDAEWPETIWLDHDLGGRVYQDSDEPNCGMSVVRCLEAHDQPALRGPQYVVHTWNLPAGIRMTQRLREAGYRVEYRPFVPRIPQHLANGQHVVCGFLAASGFVSGLIWLIRCVWWRLQEACSD